MREEYGASTLVAATVPAVVLLFNAGGNWMSAWAMGRGIQSWLLLAIGALGMGLTQFGIFSASLGEEIRIICALLFGIFGAAVVSLTMLPALTVTVLEWGRREQLVGEGLQA